MFNFRMRDFFVRKSRIRILVRAEYLTDHISAQVVIKNEVIN